MRVELDVGNTDRAFGTIFGSEITRKFGNSLPDDTFHVVCHGYGGQSFGAFIPAGLTLELIGDSNDYLGKGLSGGTLIVYPPADAAYKASENIVIGNVALYGATEARPSSTVWPASASACATPAPPPWWRAWATTAASI